MKNQTRRVYQAEEYMERRARVAQGSARKLAMVQPKGRKAEEHNQTARSRKYKRRRDKSDWLFYALVMLVVVMLFFYSKVRAVGQDDVAGDESLYYRELVDGYTQILREELADKGYANSGITTTGIFEGQIRTYKIGIHNERFDRLEEEEQTHLLASLEEIPFQAAGVRVELSIIP